MTQDERQDQIVRAAIHPSIGVARLGNSPDDFFLGPEVVNPPPEAPGFYRDKHGRLKRQAARFRIYGLDAAGNVVRELTAADAEITWKVHLANKKSAWYQFQLALDIPEAASSIPSLLRNAAVGDRSQLVIDPGPRTIGGTGQSGGVFDTGRFMGTAVYLGELRTDEAGRLIVLGGRGKSASYDGSRAITFANNEAWYDDTSDGPVTATVNFGGQELPVDPAWVVVAPPNYGPLQKSVRTMWDLMRDVAIQAGMMTAPVQPSFQSDIRPIFERMSTLQWVNAGFAGAFGWKGPYNLATEEWLGRLSKNEPNDQQMRETILNQFRSFIWDSWSPKPWPWLYGDAMNIPAAQTPRQMTALSDTQLAMLAQWAKGHFVADYDASAKNPQTIDDVPVTEQPAMLDRASLEFCLADAFHPGCEMTWVMRQPSIYMKPFRIAHAEPDWIEPNYGPLMNPGMVPPPPSPPFMGQTAGGITRWMAVPWQTDTASCRSGYSKDYDPYVPTFWPARVPNHVMTEKQYEIVMDASKPMDDRKKAFVNRQNWVHSLLGKGYFEQINNMISNFDEMGVVEHREGPGDENFPASMHVENLPELTRRRLAETAETRRREDIDLTGIEKVRRFPRGLRNSGE